MVVRRVLASRSMRDYAFMTVGLALTAYGLVAFLIPNKIAAGGVSGLATIIYHVLLQTTGISFSVALQVLIMNAILLAIATRERGFRYAAKTIYGIVALSFFLDVIGRFTPPLASEDLLLAALFGGAVTGLGVGLVFKAGGNTGGTDIVAQLLARRLPFGVGQIMLAIDAAVTLLAAVAFGPVLAMYGAVAIFVGSVTIDTVLEGLPIEKAVYVISGAAEDIAQSVLHELGRGATFIDATGAYTGEPRGMLLVILSRNELDDLKAIVREHDSDAMVIISNVAETIGEGFQAFGPSRP